MGDIAQLAALSLIIRATLKYTQLYQTNKIFFTVKTRSPACFAFSNFTVI